MKDINIQIMDTKLLLEEVRNDETIFDRIRFFGINDLRDSNTHYFVVLKSNKKVIGISRQSYFRLDAVSENNLSISYLSIDKNYRYRGYSKYMLEELFKYASKKKYIISLSCYSYLGKMHLKNNIHTISKKYNVEIIDKDEMLDNEKMYVHIDDKIFHRDEITN